MDDNTLKAILRLCDLAEYLEDSKNSATTEGRDKVLNTLDKVFDKLDVNNTETEHEPFATGTR